MAEEATATSTETEVSGDLKVEGSVGVGTDTPEIQVSPSDTEKTPQHFSRNKDFEFDDDTIGWLENKGFESPQAMVTSQRELEGKMGGPPEMLQKWPESDDKEGFKAIFQRLGTPETVEGYKFEFEEGAQVDNDTLTWFKEKALERNMPVDMAQGIMLDWNAEVGRIQAAQAQEIEVRDKTEETELRNAWGTKYDERIDYGHRALLALGLQEDNINVLQGALGPKTLAELAAKIADTMGEDTIAEQTQTASFGTTKEQIKNSIDELMKELGGDDERYKKFYADHATDRISPEATGKDFRRKKQLDAQLEALISAESGA